MKALTLLLLFSTFQVSAHEVCQEVSSGPLEELLKLQRRLQWHAAADHEVRSAHCLRKDVFTIEEMNNWMNAHDGKRINTNVHGIQFEDESEENIRAFKHLTTALDVMGRADPQRQKSFNSSCTNVSCAMNEIFGKQTATHLLFMSRKFGMNGSHLTYESSDPWNKNELNTLLLALSDFPEGILPIQENKKMSRFKRGYMRNNGEQVIANAAMEFFDPFSRQSAWQKRTTVVHELAHVIGIESKVDDSKEWSSYGGWSETTKMENGQQVTHYGTTDAKAVSHYGEANQYEDFAEAVVAYRYNPQLLLKVSPQKYELIKHTVFDNVEYTSEKACKNPKRTSDELKSKATAFAKDWKPRAENITRISQRCNELALKKLSLESINLSNELFQTCYQDGINKEILSELNKTLSDLAFRDYLDPLIRNIKVANIDPAKLQELTHKAQENHRSLLKKEISHALKKSLELADNNCEGNQLNYTYQRLDEGALGISTYLLKDDITALARRTCSQLVDNRSYLTKKLNSKFSDKEIESKVNELIK